MPIKNKHLLHYVPHGINDKIFKKLDKSDKNYKEIKSLYLGNKSFDFVVGFNSRNAHRKHPANLILGFKHFCDSLSIEDSKKCALILHSDLVHEAGTDLVRVAETLCPDYTVIVKDNRLSHEQIVAFYNLCDVVANVSSNEGFGLSIAEAIMCEVPVIATLTGGLQDQMGNVDDNGNLIEFTNEFSTNSTWKFKNHGNWVKPLIPDTYTLQGSPATPYIMDEIVDYRAISDAIGHWYSMSPEMRSECASEGRKWLLGDGGLNVKNMCDNFIKAMDYTLENFSPVKKFDIYEYSDKFNLNKLPNNKIGMEL